MSTSFGLPAKGCHSVTEPEPLAPPFTLLPAPPPSSFATVKFPDPSEEMAESNQPAASIVSIALRNEALIPGLLPLVNGPVFVYVEYVIAVLLYEIERSSTN